VPPEIVTWLNFCENAELTMSERMRVGNNFLITYLKGQDFFSNPSHKIVVNEDLL